MFLFQNDGMEYIDCPLRVVNGQAHRMLEHLTVYFDVLPVEGLHIALMEAKAKIARRQEMLRLWGNSGYKDIPPFKHIC